MESWGRTVAREADNAPVLAGGEGPGGAAGAPAAGGDGPASWGDPAGRGAVGLRVESVRTWVKQAEIDTGETPGVTTAEAQRIKDLEQEVRELRRANAILKSASAFFAAELDRPQR
jgi:hypothetical protein